MNANPFILLEADVAFYLDDGSGECGSRIWMGGTAERLVLSGDFKERMLYRPGEAFGEPYHEDEEHSIELDNLWLEDLTSLSMPQITRNARMAMVVVWLDEDTGAWVKRTYYGVKARSQRVHGEIASSRSLHDGMQSLKFRAESKAPDLAGIGSRPDMTPHDTGIVRYVDGSLVMDVAWLSYETGLFFNMMAPQFAAFEYGTGSLTIRIAGEVAAVLTPAGIQVSEIIATGGTFPPTSEPRIEFIGGGRRLASLARSGVLAVPDIIERDSVPSGHFNLRAGDAWLFSLANGKAYAPGFFEILETT